MKTYFLIFITALFGSCQFFNVQQKEERKDQPIASVYDSYLYLKDIADFIPKNSTAYDSVLIVRNNINTWAKHELLKRKAEENATHDEQSKYNKLVEDYRQSLLINSYKERIIKQQLDTVISENELTAYYKNNKKNFKLNEELIKIKYVHFGKDVLEQKRVIQLFKSASYEDLIMLENRALNFKALNLNDSIWIRVKDVLLKIPKFRENHKEFLLKKSKFIQKEDSLDLYLVAVKDVLKRNDVAPLHYIAPTIKQLILHKRKLGLIREIEKTFINDAIQHKTFKEY
jgi:hypothetical protein